MNNGPPVVEWCEPLPSGTRYRWTIAASCIDDNLGQLRVSGPWRDSPELAEMDGGRLRKVFEIAYRAIWSTDPWP